MPDYCWAKAVAIVVYIMNITPIEAVHGVTQKEKFIIKKLEHSNLFFLGCIAYVHISDLKMTRLDPKAIKCIFIYSLEKNDIDVMILWLDRCM